MKIIASLAVVIILLIAGILIYWNLPGQRQYHPSELGHFSANPRIELDADGRNATLLEDFTYTDLRQQVWLADRGSSINGASIPQFLWSITGGPYSGQYRNASIVHDRYCDTRTQPSELVHLMFYEACLCGGMTDNKAKSLYLAVRFMGPSWKLVTETRMTYSSTPDGQTIETPITVTIPLDIQTTQPLDQQTFDKIQQYINDHNPSIELLQSLTPTTLSLNSERQP